MSEYDGLTDAERLALQDDDDVSLALRELLDDDDEVPEENLRFSIDKLKDGFVPPDDIDQQIEAARARINQLERDFEQDIDTEMTYSDLQTKTRELNERIADLREERAASKAILSVVEAQEEQNWISQVEDAKRRARADGIDIDDPEMATQWDRAVRFLGNQAENANKPARWFLDEGMAMVRSRRDAGSSSHNRTYDHAESSSRRDGRNGGDDHLSRLSGPKLEAELAKMSPEEAERWLNS